MKKWIITAVVSALFCVAGLALCVSLLLKGATFSFPGSSPEKKGTVSESVMERKSGAAVADSSTARASSIPGITKEQAAQLPQNPADYTTDVWAVDWDEDAAKSCLEQRGDSISVVSIFAAVFDSSGQVSEPEAAATLLADLKAEFPDKKYYLSVTNDIISDGWAEAKNADLLYTLLEDEDTARQHAQQLVFLAADRGYDGLEIDYESIYGDTTLWSYLIRFEDMLADEADARGIGVRVVLEPSIPASELQFSDRVEHIVMCYDAHGIGTDAGPKADADFISGIVSNFAAVPNLSYALANGGYDWNLDSPVTEPCSDSDVEKIMQQYGGEASRDVASGALLYTYTDDSGCSHQLWYGDDQTIRTWRTMIENQTGHPVSVCIWRA